MITSMAAEATSTKTMTTLESLVNDANKLLPHKHLPPPFDELLLKYVLLQDNPILGNAATDFYLLLLSIVLLILVFVQIRAFARPPPVPLKRLPRRPTLSVLFRPDDATSSVVLASVAAVKALSQSANAAAKEEPTTSTASATKQTYTTTSSSPINVMSTSRPLDTTTSINSPANNIGSEASGSLTPPKDGSPWRRTISNVSISNLKQQIFKATSSLTGTRRRRRNKFHHQEGDRGDSDSHDRLQRPPINKRSSRYNQRSADDSDDLTDEDYILGDSFEDAQDFDDRAGREVRSDDDDDEERPFVVPSMMMDLPDSFAPLLSSSQVEVLTAQLTADLIHAVIAEGGVRMRGGRHEIPLDKDSSRPQLLLDVPKTSGCRISAVAMVGSDGFSSEEDLDVNKPTIQRSTPMVKNAGLVFDPPLPLSNVAPTLIHFPTLFEDNFVPTLRRIQIVRFLMDSIISISAFLERCLWILESKCQIHLAKIRVLPLYKGRLSESDKRGRSPDWRLQLSFSGHVLLFGWIPIPFINVTLPTFIIPQPHALLEYLLTNQPLASAKLRRENIAEQRIALALIQTAESWSTNVKVVATPPAVAVDVTLAGGVSLAVEMGLGRDPQAGQGRHDGTALDPSFVHETAPQHPAPGSVNSMSSWTTNVETSASATMKQRQLPSTGSMAQTNFYDANELVPWKIEVAAKGSVSHEKMSVHILKFAMEHQGVENGSVVRSSLATRGSLAFWKVRPEDGHAITESTPLRRRVASFGHRRVDSYPRFALDSDDTPSVAAVLLFPDQSESFHRDMRMLKYDYAFDVFDDSKLDAITVTIGATHPMLNGGTMITTILDSIYAFGSCAAREDAILDPEERKRKRNVLRHLPATDFTFGVDKVYIPHESYSYSDDGQTLFVPEASDGRMMVRLLGGIQSPDEMSMGSSVATGEITDVKEGIKVVADFDIPSLVLRTEGLVKEFPELEIFEGVKLRTNLSGIVSGGVRAHLRPQKIVGPASSTGRNIFNPLEAYEIDFSRSALSLKIKEYTATLGHRRVIFPAESTVAVLVHKSVVDMGFEGATQCELSWDFQGLSPIFQVTRPGMSPAEATPEDKEQVSLLIAPLRQGRLSLNVSSVGGISIEKAATSREDKEGLYDWKFFNALVCPDDESVGRILDVIHDKRTMDKFLQLTSLINKDLHRLLKYVLKQVWRAKEVFDQEGISDPGHVIPMYKMARLISLFITGEADLVDQILPIIERIVKGDGLDVIKVKDLLREHFEKYDDWAPELDRVVRWAAVMLGPMAGVQSCVEENVIPLCQQPHYASKFRDIPSAAVLYKEFMDRPQLPLDPSFSSLISGVAPYLTFKQIEFFLVSRPSSDWQPSDLRRVRYVYSIKRKVLEIAESYGGLSFLPQSFLVSVFLGEATRSSLRASTRKARRQKIRGTPQAAFSPPRSGARRQSTVSRLRRRRGANLETRLQQVAEATFREETDEVGMTPAERVAYMREYDLRHQTDSPQDLVLELRTNAEFEEDTYELGDSLLGPQEVAILLQAGLTSVMKSSTVVQLNQRMLLDLICSQPRSFAVAVLAEIGSPSGQGSQRGLTSALMALLELDQTAFKPNHQIDMHTLLESWLPGLKIPRREDYLAGGRWARQSYYDALSSVATSILEDAESYAALKGHLQRVYSHKESDPIPKPREEPHSDVGLDLGDEYDVVGGTQSRLQTAVLEAKNAIDKADDAGQAVMDALLRENEATKSNEQYHKAIRLYHEAFNACSKVLSLDKHAFHSGWFRDFYRRNYDALMVRSMHDNVVHDVDNVRYWLHRLLIGAKTAKVSQTKDLQERVLSSSSIKELSESSEVSTPERPTRVFRRRPEYEGDIFLRSEHADEQVLLDAILDAIIYDETSREKLRNDPLVRLLIPNPPGQYNFTIVTAMGVVTEGKKGLELVNAFERLESERGVKVIRSDTATARSFEYNASKIEDAIGAAIELGKPYGYIGYSQGCANALMAESTLLSGTPTQQKVLSSPNGASLICRQLLFSAANGSFHGPAMDKKVQRLIVLSEEFFKYQQGYVSRALSSSVLEILTSILDSAHFHKFMGGAQSFLPEGCRAFWREAQHLAHVPTCTLRGVMEDHTTPECLEMISHLLAKQSGSPHHDSQVHVYDAVGHPVYYHNRNGRILKQCDVGDGAVQRTHHWSPLCDEVEFVRTTKDVEMASFDCAKDRHVFPWVDVNVRFGFIKYVPDGKESKNSQKEMHPLKLVDKSLASGNS